jgi:hypothetical protein
MATLLVALATKGGSPRKINNGRLSREPPPARVLINPDANPTNNTSAASCQAIARD